MYFANLSVLFLSNYYLVLLLGDLDFSVITHSYFMFGKRYSIMIQNCNGVLWNIDWAIQRTEAGKGRLRPRPKGCLEYFTRDVSRVHYRW